MVVGTPVSPPHAIVLLFPGGDGAGHFSERGSDVRLGGNFLVRTTPLFVEQGFLAAIVDVPSDRPGGMDDQFRTSEAHVEDVRALIEFLGTMSSAPVYLAGTSRGTISVAHLGINRPDPRVQGIVLTASMAQRLGPRSTAIRLSNQALDRIGLPTLYVHHRDDGCFASQHADALLLPPRMTSSPRVNFITVVGGDPPRSDPCEAMSQHGFLGKEREVVAAIADWVAGRPVPEQIGP
jgi:pimeloyl-ACP methyl ester carboxylesterase